MLQAPLLHSLVVASFGDGHNQMTGSKNQPRGALCTLGAHAVAGEFVCLHSFTFIPFVFRWVLDSANPPRQLDGWEIFEKGLDVHLPLFKPLMPPKWRGIFETSPKFDSHLCMSHRFLIFSFRR